MEYIFLYDSPIGTLYIKANHAAITNITIYPINGEIKETKLIKQCINELEEYFEGKRTYFTFPIEYHDTPFREKCYKALQTIPYGKTISYKELAIKIGNPNASRAVGQAIHYNPLLIVIPCHRIINSNNTLGGFGAGINNKIKLLYLENIKDVNL